MIEALRLFVDVVRCKSFSQAAVSHGITQSAASQRVGQLEKRLGVTLLDRSVRPLEATEAGRVFLEGARDVLERFDRLERRVSAVGVELSGTVYIQAIYSSGIDLLDRVQHDFENRYPKASVDIEYAKPDEVYEAVVEGDADIGILSYPERFKRVTTIALREEEMSVVCTPDHPLAGADAIHAGDLQGYDMIGFDQDLPVGRRVVAYLREHGVTPSFINTFDNLDTLKTAVMDTQRATILPRRTVRREAEAGSLHVLTLTPTLRRPIGLIHRSGVKMRGRSRPGDTGLSPIATQFIDDLLAFARAEDQRSAASNGRRSTTSPTPDRFAAILAGADS